MRFILPDRAPLRQPAPVGAWALRIPLYYLHANSLRFLTGNIEPSPCGGCPRGGGEAPKSVKSSSIFLMISFVWSLINPNPRRTARIIISSAKIARIDTPRIIGYIPTANAIMSKGPRRRRKQERSGGSLLKTLRRKHTWQTLHRKPTSRARPGSLRNRSQTSTRSTRSSSRSSRATRSVASHT